MLQAAIDKSQQFVSGRVRLKLYRGNVGVVGRESKYSLYDKDLVTFEEGAVAYDQRDAAGFIRLNALRLRTLGQRKRKLKLSPSCLVNFCAAPPNRRRPFLDLALHDLGEILRRLLLRRHDHHAKALKPILHR